MLYPRDLTSEDPRVRAVLCTAGALAVLGYHPGHRDSEGIDLVLAVLTSTACPLLVDRQGQLTAPAAELFDGLVDDLHLAADLIGDDGAAAAWRGFGINAGPELREKLHSDTIAAARVKARRLIRLSDEVDDLTVDALTPAGAL